MSVSAVSCTGICKRFDQYLYPSQMLQDHILQWNRHRTHWSIDVLKDVSFEVQPGEWLGVYGPNGCGKTTLLRILAGLLPPDSGMVQHHGQLSCFFELSAGFHQERSAVENVYMHGLLHGMTPSALRTHIQRVIEFAELESHADVPIKYFSTGMIMRLGFAAATQMEADIYLFDEILAVGDKVFREKCQEQFSLLRTQGKTIILVNHNFASLEKLCDSILVFEKERVRKILPGYFVDAEKGEALIAA